ncbi:hypothetical protein HYH03_004160 [Edaphochlamys debaryana]|uniref:Nuclear pore complex protein n=1 Tax=Edaphochlamys debaryana TaxID=47281 RepID=A0A835YA12_9CHLO|nr:hypothetical protein HYH03_004160 [Edaphochlamys debaryana]|eukprot:KAG2497894.1 hypothetical protein HYH03_004160 [Edaphochlamys debaryana]
MDIELPGASVGPAAALEEELAQVFAVLLGDEQTAQDAVTAIADVCQRRAEALRAEAADQLHRPARHMHLASLADEMEAQAATWQLLFCLYCDEGAPAGEGGAALRDAGGAILYRQRLADAAAAEPELARCARVVAWLESLADESLKRAGGAAFAPGEGLWHETKTEMRTGTGSVVSELDPDAPSRLGRPLHPSNARSQERILARVWQLMRAGHMPEALELCAHVGQPWRAAALGGGGPYGSLPVGEAAAQADEAVTEEQQAEELADEVANGSGSLLSLWRWAALQASGAGGPSDNKLERAVFAALGGNAAGALPACSTWEDAAWAQCRTWLENQLAKSVPPEPHAASDLVSGDAVTAALVRCGVAPAAAARGVEAALTVALASSAGAAGAAAAADGSGDAVMGSASAVAAPLRGGSFAQLFAHHVMAPGSGSLVQTGSAAVQSLRQIQGLLVQGDMYDLAAHLYGALVDRRGGGGAADADGAADGSAAAAPNPERKWRSCALAAHMLLTLEGLGVLTSAPGGGAAAAALADPIEVHKTLDLSQRLLAFFAGSLLERGRLSLLPPYLCALRPPLRAALCGELLAAHTRRLTGVAAATGEAGEEAPSAAQADNECFGAYLGLGGWFRRCAERQQQPPQALRSAIPTDIRPHELRLQLASFAAACRRSRSHGPHQRARVARWLVYPYLEAAEGVQEQAAARRAAADSAPTPAAAAAASDPSHDSAEAQAAAAAALLDPLALGDLLSYACCLASELALGDDVTAAAGQALFAEVVPEGVELVALAAAEQLSQTAAAEAEADVDGAVGEAAAEASFRLAAQLRDQAAELSNWRLYFRLDARLAAWLSRHEALAAAGGGAGSEAEALVREGGELLSTFLQELLQAGWQQALASPDRALAEAEDGVVRLALTVTAPPPPPGSHLAPPGVGGWGQPTAAYPELRGAALLEFSLALQAGLARAAAASGLEPGALQAAVEVAGEGGGAEAEGHISINLAVPAEPRAWQGLVGLACSLLRGGAEAPGLPPLLLVALDADRATSLAVARRCAVSQAVMRCAALRLSLVALGLDADAPAAGPQLLELLAEPPAAVGGTGGAALPCRPGAGGLAELLSRAQLQHVLGVEAETVVTHLRNQQQRQREGQRQQAAAAAAQGAARRRA